MNIASSNLRELVIGGVLLLGVNAVGNLHLINVHLFKLMESWGVSPVQPVSLSYRKFRCFDNSHNRFDSTSLQHTHTQKNYYGLKLKENFILCGPSNISIHLSNYIQLL